MLLSQVLRRNRGNSINPIPSYDDVDSIRANSYRTDIPNTLNRSLYSYVNGQVVRKQPAKYIIPDSERILQDAIDKFSPANAMAENFTVASRKLKALDNQRVIQEYINKPIRDKANEREDKIRQEDKAEAAKLRKEDLKHQKQVRQEYFKRIKQVSDAITNKLADLEDLNTRIADTNLKFQRQLQTETQAFHTDLQGLVRSGKYEELENMREYQIQALNERKNEVLSEIENSYRMLRNPATDPNNRDNFLRLSPKEAKEVSSSKRNLREYLRDNPLTNMVTFEDFDFIIQKVENDITGEQLREEQSRYENAAEESMRLEQQKADLLQQIDEYEQAIDSETLEREERARMEAERARLEEELARLENVDDPPEPKDEPDDQPGDNQQDDNQQDDDQPDDNDPPKSPKPRPPTMEKFKSRLFLVPTTNIDEAQFIRFKPKEKSGSAADKFLEKVQGKNAYYEGFVKKIKKTDFTPKKVEMYKLIYSPNKVTPATYVKVEPLLNSNIFAYDNDKHLTNINTAITRRYEEYEATGFPAKKKK